jgi:hypothetical protein
MGYSAPNEVRLIMTHRAINSGTIQLKSLSLGPVGKKLKTKI